MRFLREVENRQHLLFLGQGDGQVQERVEGDGYLKIEKKMKGRLVVKVKK